MPLQIAREHCAPQSDLARTAAFCETLCTCLQTGHGLGDEKRTDAALRTDEPANRTELMKRLALPAVIVLLVAIAVAVLLPLLVSSDAVRAKVLSKAQLITGRQITFRNSPRITFNPFLGVEIDSVALLDPQASELDPPLLQMEKLQGRILVLPAIFGRIEIGSYRFVRPRFNLRVREDGSANWKLPSGSITSLLGDARSAREATVAGRAPDLSDLPTLSVGHFEIIDGTAYYENRQNGRRETLTNINAAFAWPDTASALQLNGDCIWRGEAFEFSTSSQRPLLLLSGGTVPVAANLEAGAFSFEFNGDANLLANLHLSGPGRLKAGSIRRLASLFGGSLPPGSTLSGFSVAGIIEATQSKLAFSDAEVSLDGNAGRGALQLSFDKADMAKIDGTIAADFVDLAPYLDALAATPQEGSPDSTGLKALLSFDLDLRISAQTAKAGPHLLADVAASVSINNGEALIEVGNAAYAGGLLTGTLAVALPASQFTVLANGRLNGFEASKTTFGPDAFHLSGAANAEFSGKSGGRTLQEVRQSASGMLKLEVSNGVLSGADLQQLLLLSQPGSSSVNLPALSGETAFRALDAEISLSPTIASISKFHVANSKVTGEATGQARFGEGGIAIHLKLSPGPAALSGLSPTKPARLFIGGSFKAPLVTLEQPTASGQ